MKFSIPESELQEYLNKQLQNYFPDNGKYLNYLDKKFKISWDDAVNRTENCFLHINVPNFQREGEAYLSHLNMDQWSMFLYFFSNSLWKMTQEREVCSKLILLNRALSGAWFSFNAELPEIFLFVHSVGSVIGHRNVRFSDFLVIMQNVTINSIPIGNLTLGKGLFLGAGSKLIGGGKIGNRVSVGANTAVREPHISDDSVVFRNDYNGIFTIKKNTGTCFAQRYFYDDLSKL